MPDGYDLGFEAGVPSSRDFHGVAMVVKAVGMKVAIFNVAYQPICQKIKVIKALSMCDIMNRWIR